MSAITTRTAIIDGDSHLYEPRDMWRDYTNPTDRDVALTIEEDSLGYPWVSLHGQPLDRVPAFVGIPGDFDIMGRDGQRWREGLPYTHIPYDDRPLDYTDPTARLESMDRWGIDEVVLFPQWGFQWESHLAEDRYARRVNMEAWNRWAGEYNQVGQGRFHVVGHARFDDDPRWLREQFKMLSAAGIRLVLMQPGLVNGHRLSHPTVDPVWRLLVEYGMSPAWHIAQEMRNIYADVDAWTENDSGGLVKLVTAIFTRVSAELALSDLTVNGVFERYPDLRIATAEIGAEWFPILCRRLDRAWRLWESTSGLTYNAELSMLPSEYLHRAVRLICSFPTDATPTEMVSLGKIAAFGGDYPHPEGLAEPFVGYREILGPVGDDIAANIYGGNIARLLHR